MAVEQLGPSEVQKLRELIVEGNKTQEEIQSLRESLSETVACVAEELSIPKAQITKAMKIAFKGKFSDEEHQLQQIGEILSKTGFKD